LPSPVAAVPSPVAVAPTKVAPSPPSETVAEPHPATAARRTEAVRRDTKQRARVRVFVIGAAAGIAIFAVLAMGRFAEPPPVAVSKAPPSAKLESTRPTSMPEPTVTTTTIATAASVVPVAPMLSASAAAEPSAELVARANASGEPSATAATSATSAPAASVAVTTAAPTGTIVPATLAPGKGAIGAAAPTACRWLLDGVQLGFDWHIDIEVEPGVHDVSCLGPDGKTRTQSVKILKGEIRGMYF